MRIADCCPGQRWILAAGCRLPWPYSLPGLGAPPDAQCFRRFAGRGAGGLWYGHPLVACCCCRPGGGQPGTKRADDRQRPYSGPDLATALISGWGIDGSGPIPFPFAFVNGIYGPGVLGFLGANGLIDTAVSFSILLTFNRCATGAAQRLRCCWWPPRACRARLAWY